MTLETISPLSDDPLSTVGCGGLIDPALPTIITAAPLLHRFPGHDRSTVGVQIHRIELNWFESPPAPQIDGSSILEAIRVHTL
jgi:hypothetical protein